MAAGCNMGRSVLAGAIPALVLRGIIFAGFEYQVTLAIQVGVFVGGVVLQLLITPALTPSFGGPLVRVWRGSSRPIKFIAPGKLPQGGLTLGGGRCHGCCQRCRRCRC